MIEIRRQGTDAVPGCHRIERCDGGGKSLQQSIVNAMINICQRYQESMGEVSEGAWVV